MIWCFCSGLKTLSIRWTSINVIDLSKCFISGSEDLRIVVAPMPPGFEDTMIFSSETHDFSSTGEASRALPANARVDRRPVRATPLFGHLDDCELRRLPAGC